MENPPRDTSKEPTSSRDVIQYPSHQPVPQAPTQYWRHQPEIEAPASTPPVSETPTSIPGTRHGQHPRHQPVSQQSDITSTNQYSGNVVSTAPTSIPGANQHRGHPAVSEAPISREAPTSIRSISQWPRKASAESWMRKTERRMGEWMSRYVGENYSPADGDTRA